MRTKLEKSYDIIIKIIIKVISDRINDSSVPQGAAGDPAAPGRAGARHEAQGAAHPRHAGQAGPAAPLRLL